MSKIKNSGLDQYGKCKALTGLAVKELSVITLVIKRNLHTTDNRIKCIRTIYNVSNRETLDAEKVKILQKCCSITSIGHRADFSFLAVSPQVTLVINPVVGCHYFPPGPQIHFQPKRAPPPPLAGTNFYCLVTEAHRCKWLAQGH